MRFFLRIVFTAVATWLVSLILPGLEVESFGSDWWQVALTTLAVAFAFGFINATIGNLIRIVAFPLYILTLGIISFFVNGLLLMIVHWVSEALGWGLYIDNYWWGILGAFLISLTTGIITMITRPVFGKRRQRKR
ncbi:phage holin family protein [uncultured Agrococcus sp.]|uniref:phage holin family protein n=1 Tax=uncultured Agrococcus sp. TaxID=382258 RepID=UPI0025D0D525|nr:phage holin family protein [uncultured Agrococcus sp.]